MIELKQQIFLATHPFSFPAKGFELSKRLAEAYGKEVCLLGIPSKKEQDTSVYETTFSRWIAERQGEFPVALNQYVLEAGDDFTDVMEHSEASMIIFETGREKPYNKPLRQLELCRQLRIPYFFVKPEHAICFDRVLVPVGFLNEEREKGPFSSSMGRFFRSEIVLMPAKDYGSRTRTNTNAICTLLDKFALSYQRVEAAQNSFKVEIEAARRAGELQADMLIISASRDYGLDDIFFGPKELKVIQQSPVPVMVINPRKDLYALCG